MTKTRPSNNTPATPATANVVVNSVLAWINFSPSTSVGINAYRAG